MNQNKATHSASMMRVLPTILLIGRDLSQHTNCSCLFSFCCGASDVVPCSNLASTSSRSSGIDYLFLMSERYIPSLLYRTFSLYIRFS